MKPQDLIVEKVSDDKTWKTSELELLVAEPEAEGDEVASSNLHIEEGTLPNFDVTIRKQ